MSNAPPTPTQTPTTILLLELNPDEGCGLDVVDEEGVELDCVTKEVCVTIIVFPLSTEANVVKSVELLELERVVGEGEEVVGFVRIDVVTVEVLSVSVVNVLEGVDEENEKLDGDTVGVSELKENELLDVENDWLGVENREEEVNELEVNSPDDNTNRGELMTLREFPSARATNCSIFDPWSEVAMMSSSLALTISVAMVCDKTREKTVSEVGKRVLIATIFKFNEGLSSLYFECNNNFGYH